MNALARAEWVLLGQGAGGTMNGHRGTSSGNVILNHEPNNLAACKSVCACEGLGGLFSCSKM